MDYSVAVDKIRKCIESSKNKLHLDTCVAMLAQFKLHQCSQEYEKTKEEVENILTELLDNKQREIYLTHL